MRDLNNGIHTDDLFRMGFWAMAIDGDEEPTTEEVLAMADDLQVMAADAVSYWLKHRRAPWICDPEEDDE